MPQMQARDTPGSRLTPGHVDYGTHDRPAEPLPEFNPDNVPLKVHNAMANQISVERPPIEDDDYIPQTKEELSRAARAVAERIPIDKVSIFYRDIKTSLEKIEKESSNKKIKENKMTKSKKSVIKEEVRDEADVEADAEDRANLSALMKASSKKLGASYRELADVMGFGPESGARQDEMRVTRKLKFFLDGVGTDDLDALRNVAVPAYIDLMLSGKYIDEDDAKELKSAPEEVVELDTFRNFFNEAFVKPSIKILIDGAEDKYIELMTKLRIPTEMHQMIANQGVGNAKRDVPRLKAKIDELVFAKKLPAGKEKIILQSVLNIVSIIAKKQDEIAEQFLPVARKMYQELPAPAKKKALEKALKITDAESSTVDKKYSEFMKKQDANESVESASNYVTESIKRFQKNTSENSSKRLQDYAAAEMIDLLEGISKNSDKFKNESLSNKDALIKTKCFKHFFLKNFVMAVNENASKKNLAEASIKKWRVLSEAEKTKALKCSLECAYKGQ